MAKGKELTVEAFLGSCEVDFAGLSFEKGLALLEELVSKVEEGSLPLDQAIGAYERGVGLIEHLQGQLGSAEEKLRVLRKKTEGKISNPEGLEVREVDEG